MNLKWALQLKSAVFMATLPLSFRLPTILFGDKHNQIFLFDLDMYACIYVCLYANDCCEGIFLDLTTSDC